jgi:UDP-N-acetyl-D-galactosamine dehydrogenase
MLKVNDANVGVIGLGYVGLPLANAFSDTFPVIGYDQDTHRISQLQNGYDFTLEVTKQEIDAGNVTFVSDINHLGSCNVYIITVPTPIDEHNVPDLTILKSVCDDVGKLLDSGNIVIFESTVYPGATEEVCVPILEKSSGLKFNEDFFVGYSPERINPGDSNHNILNTNKVVSGSTKETADFIELMYSVVLDADVHRAPSIKVAEASKIIENTQRDVNIALANEFAMIFNQMGIDTQEVLEAAGTKWNFQKFQPGLVGGHCIGVDPFYLAHKAQSIGHHPEMILAGRRVNDGMGKYVARDVVQVMASKGTAAVGSKILILGMTFKENCSDIRNTKVVDVKNELEAYGANIDVFDSWADVHTVKRDYDFDLIDVLEPNEYDAVVLAVAHDDFIGRGVKFIRSLTKGNGVIYDVKRVFDPSDVDGGL